MHHLAAVDKRWATPLAKLIGIAKPSPAGASTHQGVQADHLTGFINQWPQNSRVDGRIGLDQLEPLIGEAKAADVAVQAADNAEVTVLSSP